MEYEKIQKLIEDVSVSKLSNVEIEFPDGTKISLNKQTDETKQRGKTEKEKTEREKEEKEKIEKEKEEIKEVQETKQTTVKTINSPMVGTFYSKPSPDANTFVEIGSVVTKGQTVCIIEAMKLMNEIETEFDGKIVEVYVKDGDIVEYGTPLFGME